jgi:hypothetical protein
MNPSEINNTFDELAAVVDAFFAHRQQIVGRPPKNLEALAQADAMIEEWAVVVRALDMLHQHDDAFAHACAKAGVNYLSVKDREWLRAFRDLVAGTICAPRENG